MNYSWIHKENGDWWIVNNNGEYEASLGRWDFPNVQFINDSPDVEIVLMMADKIRELEWDKIVE
jgi:hypothetical protein